MIKLSVGAAADFLLATVLLSLLGALPLKNAATGN
jgi:hypothetical protein